MMNPISKYTRFLWKRLDIWVEEHQGMISSKEKRNRSKINKLDKEGLNLTFK